MSSGIRVVVLSVLGVLVAAGCAPAAPPQTENTPAPAAKPAPTATVTSSQGQVPFQTPTPTLTPSPTPHEPLSTDVTARIRATEGLYYLSPDTFQVTGGATVLFEVASADYSHTFTVPEIGLSINVPAGETARQTFLVPNAPGSYKVFCTVSGHRSQGMERTFVVVPGTGPDVQPASATPAADTPPYNPPGY